MKKFFIFLPLIILLIISVFLFIYLLKDKKPNHPPSALLNEDVPNFVMNNLFFQNQNITNINIRNKLTLINFFASWCSPCKTEHPLFFKIKGINPNVFIVGISYKDKKSESINYLEKYKNPYDLVGIDDQGLIGLDFGVFGLPETFLVNSSGKIIYKHLGPITDEIIKNEIIPLFSKLN